MAFEGDFTVAQNSPSTITLTDASVGSDPTITARRIYLYQYNNVTIIPINNPAGQSWIDWNISDTSITLTDIFDRDYCLNITVVWLTDTPDPSSVYIKNHAFPFADYTEEFIELILQTRVVGQPSVVNNATFFQSWVQLRIFRDQAVDIVNETSDIMKGQLLLNACYGIMIKPTFYFS